MKRLPLLLIIVMAVFISCKKDKVEQEPPEPAKVDNTFPVRFIWVNHGDSTVKDIVLSSYYYDKVANVTHLHDKSYGKYLTGEYMYHDSIMHQEYKGTLGCHIGFEVDIAIRNSKGNFVRQMDYVSTSNDYGDTIKKASDGIVIFHWPEDTARYIKTYDWHDPNDTMQAITMEMHYPGMKRIWDFKAIAR